MEESFEMQKQMQMQNQDSLSADKPQYLLYPPDMRFVTDERFVGHESHSMASGTNESLFDQTIRHRGLNQNSRATAQTNPFFPARSSAAGADA